MTPRTKRDIWIGLGITVVLFLFLEIGLRIFWKIKWPQDKNPPYVAEVGWKLWPGNYKPNESSFGFSGNINSYGYRDDEWTLEKPKDTVRIICLGDSVTFGHGDKSEHGGYPNQLEILLNKMAKKKGKRVEVFNAGLPANTSRQCAYRLENELLDFDPDILIISVGHNNVVQENPRAIPTLVPDHWTKKLGEHSYFFKASFGVFFKVLLPRMVSPDTDPELYRHELENFTPPVYSRDLNRMIDLCQERNIQVVILTQPNRFNMQDFPEESYSKGYRIYYPYYDFQMHKLLSERYADTVRTIAKNRKVTLVDMDRNFRRLPDALKLFVDDAHLDHEGYTVFAKLLSSDMERSRVLRPYLSVRSVAD